jgi:glycosyltransferase involved in cell wall biosynthesis
MVGFRTKRLGSPYYRWQLRRLLGSEKCRGILAWSDAAAMTFHHAFGEKIAKKVRTVRPAIGPRPVRVRKSGAKKFLFIGYRFEEKGGRDLLEAFDLASRKADIELTVISNVPEHYLHKYRRHKDIRFELPKYSHKELTEKFYGKSDCLVFPTYVDSFGMVALEALGHGMPVISSDCFALPEMVRHGHNGLVVPLPFAYYGKDGLFREVEYASWQDYLSRIGRTRDETFIQALADNILELAQDSKLCARLSKNAAADSRKGFLSIGTRNRLLRQNYDSALAR